MPALSDTLLAGGCALHVEAIHGEPVVVLSGLDAGQTFTAVRENTSDLAVTFEGLGADLRAHRLLRFRNAVPRLAPTDRLRTADGKTWTAVRAPQDGYLTTDFELTEVTAKDA